MSAIKRALDLHILDSIKKGDSSVGLGASF